ncbi:NUDIX hydrolase [Halovulum sp. GXIMD14794]
MAKKTERSSAEQVLRAHRLPRRHLQYGALCYRKTGKGLEILLVTSRGTRRWVAPKGWPIRGKGPAGTAAQEAWEEAGVKGRVTGDSVGVYTYRKHLPKGRSMTCVVELFPVEVADNLNRFPEAKERRTKWMKPKKAAKAVDEPELARLIKRFGAEFA